MYSGHTRVFLDRGSRQLFLSQAEHPLCITVYYWESMVPCLVSRCVKRSNMYMGSGHSAPDTRPRLKPARNCERLLLSEHNRCDVRQRLYHGFQTSHLRTCIPADDGVAQCNACRLSAFAVVGVADQTFLGRCLAYRPIQSNLDVLKDLISRLVLGVGWDMSCNPCPVPADPAATPRGEEH